MVVRWARDNRSASRATYLRLVLIHSFFGTVRTRPPTQALEGPWEEISKLIKKFLWTHGEPSHSRSILPEYSYWTEWVIHIRSFYSISDTLGLDRRNIRERERVLIRFYRTLKTEIRIYWTKILSEPLNDYQISEKLIRNAYATNRFYDDDPLYFVRHSYDEKHFGEFEES